MADGSSDGEYGVVSGRFYGWQRDLPLPKLAAYSSGNVVFRPAPSTEPLGDVTAEQVAERIAKGHEPFGLWLGEELASYGWSSAGEVQIGEVDFSFVVPPDERYLWDFATLPPYRGRGLYPRLLQEILKRQAATAEWFWIGHGPHNEPSRRGILKAGFRLVGLAWHRPDGRLLLEPDASAPPEMVRRAARTLGVPLMVGD